MKHALRLGLTTGAMVIACLVTSDTARADAAGDATLAKMDAALNRAKTHYLEYDVTNQEPGKGEKKLALTIRTKGDKRLTEFTAPADMKGTKVLVLSPSQTYVYLPAFGKVRRVASSASEQGALGLTFSHDDFAMTSHGAYTARITSDAGAEIRLVATPRPGQQPPYAKIELTIMKDKMLPTELKYFNAAGKNVKTETRTGYTCEADVCTATETKMIDHAHGGAWTKMTRTTWKVNAAISDDVFSKRSLEK